MLDLTYDDGQYWVNINGNSEELWEVCLLGSFKLLRR